jgi:heat shock protein HslJ
LAWLLGCAPEPPPKEGLDGRLFLAETADDDPAPPLVGDSRLQLEFHDGTEVDASAGCNTWGASYTVEEDTFVVTDAGQDLVGCEPELSAQDDWYFAFLESSPSLTLDGDLLVLERDATRIQYRDAETATPNSDLVGPTWTVEAIVRGAIVVESEWATPATLEFAENGSVVIDTGCNTGAGTYQRRVATLSFSDVSVTSRACDGDPTIFDDDPASLDAAVLDLLRDAPTVTWRITGDRMWLDGGVAGGLELVASG